MTGRPVTEATESAAPPRASPSSLDRTTPVKSTPSWNACAVSTAACPIIASMTNRTSSGWMAARMSAASRHQRLVDGQPAGGVDDHDVVLTVPRLRDPGARHRDRVAERPRPLSGAEHRVVAADVALLGRIHRYPGPLADD